MKGAEARPRAGPPKEGPPRKGSPRTRLPAAGVIAAATLALAGCQDSAPPAPLTPTRAGPFDAEQLALSREAVRRVARFEAGLQPILAAGKATVRAREFYREHLRSWQPGYAQLRAYERDEIRFARRPVVLRTRATSVKSFQDNAAEIVLVRCTDQSDLGATRAGVPLPVAHEEPVVEVVVAYRYENRTWRLGPFETTDRPCTAQAPAR